MNTLTIVPYKMIFGGNCVGKNEGKCIFISDVLPNENVSIKINETKKDFDRAELVAVINPSPFRVKPFCPLYGVCGGCNLQIASEEGQKQLRTEILVDAFERAGFKSDGYCGELPNIEYVGGNFTEYRNRFQFHNGGLKKRSGNEIVLLNDCPVAVPEIRQWLKDNEINGQRVHVFGSEKLVGEKKVICGDENSNCGATIKILGKEISFDVRGFFQSNVEVLEKLLPILTENLQGNELLDMYSGVGTLSCYAGEKFSKVTLVEHNRDALVFAEKNLYGIKHETIGLSGEKWVKMIEKQAGKKNYDAVIIDPPRTGMETQVRNWLCKNKPPVIRSLSCDPVTHARDCAALVKSGYKMQRLILADFYPQTSHVESLAFLEI